MIDHKVYMRRVFKLALKGQGNVTPNPLVGAIIVKDGKIIGQGYHDKFGECHAEISAINSTKLDLKGATLYCNLSPCSHFGKTPPCTKAIIEHGISEVVYSVEDPNPLVKDWKDILSKANIRIESDILKTEGEYLNRMYLKWIKTNKPFVAIKLASTLDGKIALADGTSKWITPIEARKMSYDLRKSFDAILVGANTVENDNPNLGLHKQGFKDPFRIILTENPGRFVKKDYAVFRDNNYAFLSDFSKLPNFCLEYNITSVLIEGGGKTVTSAFQADIVDQIYIFYSYLFFGKPNLNMINDINVNNILSAPKFRLYNLTQGHDFHWVNLLKTA